MFIRPCKGRVTSPFGMRVHPISKKNAMHWGTDFASDADNTIVAAASGKVRIASHSKSGYGNYVIITHSNGYETVYAHLHSIAVKVGQTVSKGQRIGVKGTTGNSTGVHLHFEVHTGRWNNSYSNAKNPMNYITDQNSKLVVDGYMGPATIRALQNYFKTPVDGMLSRPSTVIRALQKLLGVAQDGHLGPITTKALQKRFGTTQDGIISKPSLAIRELQRRLNNGKL